MRYSQYVSVYVDRVIARGHHMIKALHPSTFELTKDAYLTERGDCIIGIEADKAATDLNPELKKMLKKNTTIVIIILRADDVMDMVLAQGNQKLTLSDERRIVIRRSSYIDPATLAINANKSAKDIRRDLIAKLSNPATILIVDIYALDINEITSLTYEIHGMLDK